MVKKKSGELERLLVSIVVLFAIVVIGRLCYLEGFKARILVETKLQVLSSVKAELAKQGVEMMIGKEALKETQEVSK